MSRTPRLFKTNIPDDLALEFFRPLGLTSLSDSMWIHRDIFTPHLMGHLEQLLPLIEPYYQGHQKHYVTRKLTVNGYIQILRHICRNKDMRLLSREVGRKKTVAYQLQSDILPTFTFTQNDWL